jgi:hypothetical protein
LIASIGNYNGPYIFFLLITRQIQRISPSESTCANERRDSGEDGEGRSQKLILSTSAKAIIIEAKRPGFIHRHSLSGSIHYYHKLVVENGTGIVGAAFGLRTRFVANVGSPAVVGSTARTKSRSDSSKRSFHP